jgi:serine/threonine protein kinase
MSTANVTFAPGERVGDYELLLELAAGGTAAVGIAAHRGATGFERLVVVKRVHRRLTKDRQFTAMLLDEARLASSVRHPNVVPVVDVVRADDEVILVMDYVESVPLSQLLQEAERAGKRLPIAVVSRILCDVLEGLHQAHEALDAQGQPLGIVHRDVSPQNVIVGVDGVSRVIDFGIAKAQSRLARTQAGMVKGKSAYMSPEQVDSQAVDRRSDVFSAGIVLWEALTGKRLFRGEGELDEMRRVMRAPVPPPSGDRSECGPEVDALLGQALTRSPAERFQTARALARALEETVPPASAKLVAEDVEALCGAELELRRQRLRAIVGDENELERLRRGSPASQGPAVTAVRAAEKAPMPRAKSMATVLIAVTVGSMVIGAAAAKVWLIVRGATTTTASGATPSASATTTATTTMTATTTATH